MQVSRSPHSLLTYSPEKELKTNVLQVGRFSLEKIKKAQKSRDRLTAYLREKHSS